MKLKSLPLTLLDVNVNIIINTLPKEKRKIEELMKLRCPGRAKRRSKRQEEGRKK